MALVSSRTYDSFFKIKLAPKKDGTRMGYKYALREFDVYCKKLDPSRTLEEIIPEMKQANGEEVIDMIQDWINQSLVMGNNQRLRVSQLHKYLRYRGVKIDQMDMRDLEYKEGVMEEREALQLPDIQKIVEQARPLRKALYITLVSTGMPIGEAMQIKLSDLDFTQDRVIIDIKPQYTKKDSRPRKVFLTTEAHRHLEPFLKKLNPNDLVFTTNQNLKQAIASEQTSLRRIVDNLGLGKRYTSKVRTITLHAFRAYNFTQCLHKHDLAYAHRLNGHKGHMEMYARWSNEKKLSMFIELEPELFIFQRKPESEEIVSLKKEMAKYKELWDESYRLGTDKEYRRQQLEPILKSVEAKMTEQIRKTVLDEIKREKN